MNISNFIVWFLNEFKNIGIQALNYIDNIKIAGNVSLLDFTITLTILGIFITIVLTLPNNINKYESRLERKVKREKGK